SRIFASTVGEDFIEQHAKKALAGDKRSARYMEELQLDPNVVADWVAGGKEAWSPELAEKDSTRAAAAQHVLDGIYRFTDESILRPNAAMRPTWASNPWTMLVWHLKSFFYAYGKVMIGGVFREMQSRRREGGNLFDVATPALLMGLTVLPLAALGLELREEIQYEEEEEPSNKLDTWGYVGELVSRGGLLGPLELAMGVTRFGDTADGALASMAGPTL